MQRLLHFLTHISPFGNFATKINGELIGLEKNLFISNVMSYKVVLGIYIYKQCCGAETFCFRSGSDFQKISAPAPAPTLAF
jgi:hypothetical protein